MEQGLLFPSKNGDRKYKASDFTGYFSKLFSNGVFSNNSKNLQVMASTTNGLSLIVEAGYGNINGYLYQLTEPKTVVFNIADVSGTAKKGSVVLRMDLTERKMTVEVKGTDELTRNATVYELMLARISIPGNGKPITQGMIQDTRGDGNVCGFVSSLIDIDPTTLWTQFEANWNEWLSEIKGTVGDDAAANLALEIEKIKKEKYSKKGGIIEGNVEIKNEETGPSLTIRSINESNFTNAFMSFYKNTIRKGWIGFTGVIDDTLTISNETGNDINLETTGNGKLHYNGKEVQVDNDTGWKMIRMENGIGENKIYIRKYGKLVVFKGESVVGDANLTNQKKLCNIPAGYEPSSEGFAYLHSPFANEIVKLQYNKKEIRAILASGSQQFIFSFNELWWLTD
ncbi:hypothetical protein [Carnobacterium divergens]|uniref:hypothetical protein n=1 Tax=Carnobacterium divergens TaxID=2748 RepID=UPI0007F41D3C|nr:hypothetical protein [Carnobacterium divergens]SBO17983.1 Phage structural domain protein [Carnobacterium divergens]